MKREGEHRWPLDLEPGARHFDYPVRDNQDDVDRLASIAMAKYGAACGSPQDYSDAITERGERIDSVLESLPELKRALWVTGGNRVAAYRLTKVGYPGERDEVEW